MIGIFDNSSEAQQAVQELKRIGLSDSNIDVSSPSSPSSSAGSAYGNRSSSFGSDNHNDGIGGFFRSLFSDDDDSANRYSNVARHSDCIVTVHAQSDEEARRAATILDQYGSVDVDQRAMEYGYGSTTGSSFTVGIGSAYGSTDNTVLSDAAVGYTGSTADTTRNDLTDSTSIPII